MDKLVSILIPVYNREGIVGETIQSAINQTYKNLEIVICDNCSTDGTWQVLLNYASKDRRIRLLKNKKNIGPVRNWERCVEEANGEYIKILFSDDLIAENFVQETMKILSGNDDIGFVYSKVLLKQIDQTIPMDKFSIESFGQNVIIQNSKIFIYKKIFGFDGLPNSPGCAMFRKKDIQKNLLIDIPNPDYLDFSKFGAGNDLLLFLLTATEYSKIAFTSNTHSVFQGHKESFSAANNLKIYYDYAKLYFLKRNKYLVRYLIIKFYIFINKHKNRRRVIVK